MPAWLVPLLIKLAIQFLEKTGAINEVEALVVRGYVAAKNLKTYPEYPTGKGGRSSG